MNNETHEDLSPEEWMRRYAARLMEAGGMNERAAMDAGRDAYEQADDPSDLFNPEDAADMEMADWEDDGEELHGD